MRSTFPKLCQHKSSKQAYVTYSNRQFYLGAWGSKESKLGYARFVAELAAGQIPSVFQQPDLTVSEIVLRFMEHKRSDKTVSEKQIIAYARATLLMDQLYGSSLAKEFGSKAYQACIHHVAKTRAAQTANNIGQLIRAVIKWAVHQELIPADCWMRLHKVPGVSDDEAATPARKVMAVNQDDFEKTLPELPPMLRTLMRLAQATGARIGELLIMRPCDITKHDDARGTVWTYQPERHKTARHGHERHLVFGAHEFEDLSRWLDGLKPDEFVFTPARSEQARLAELHAKRVTPMNQGNKPGYSGRTRSERKAGSKRVKRDIRSLDPNKPYQSAEIGKAVMRAAARAGVKHWSPHQLRHAKATHVADILSSDAAQAILGHARRTTTERYAKIGLKRVVNAYHQSIEADRPTRTG